MFYGRKNPHIGFGELRLRQELERDLGDHCQRSLACDQYPCGIVSCYIFDRPLAGADDLAVGADGTQCHHIVLGDPVFGCAHPAGIFADIAAETGVLLACRIRRIK